MIACSAHVDFEPSYHHRGLGPSSCPSHQSAAFASCGVAAFAAAAAVAPAAVANAVAVALGAESDGPGVVADTASFVVAG